MYEGGMEIMVPYLIKAVSSILPSQYLWMSEDKRIVIDVSKGNVDMAEDDLDNRLCDYCSRLCRNTNGFEFIRQKRIRMFGKVYGEIRYRSHMRELDFFNMFILGAYKGKELITTIQCPSDYANHNLHIFEYIADSIRVLNESPA
jgi:hypothetical protein